MIMSKGPSWLEEWHKKKSLREELYQRIQNETLMEPVSVHIGNEKYFELMDDGGLRDERFGLRLTKKESIDLAQWIFLLWGINHDEIPDEVKK